METILDPEQNRPDCLSEREKGDIYWRKQVSYLQAVKSRKQKADSGRYGRKAALDILSKDSRELLEKMKSGQLRITGNEFKLRPPSAAGDESYKNSVMLVIVATMVFKKALEKMLKKERTKAEDADVTYLKRLIPVMEKTLDLWFGANGVNRDTGQKEDASRIEEAKSQLDAQICSYEEAIKNYRQNTARRVIKELREELSGEPSGEETKDSFDELISAYPDNYRLHKYYVNLAVEEYRKLHKAEKNVLREIDELIELARQKDKNTAVSTLMSLSDTILEYRNEHSEKLAPLIYAEDGCEGLIRSFLTGEPADPMTANYIRAHFETEVPSLPPSSKVCDLPGYTPIHEQRDIEVSVSGPDSFEDMIKATEKLNSFMLEHRRLFFFQPIMTMLLKAHELPEFAAKAKELRYRISLSFSEGNYSTLSDDQRSILKEAFLAVETMTKVSYAVIDYNRSSEKKTLGELILSYPQDIKELNFIFQERKCRDRIEAFLREKGYN